MAENLGMKNKKRLAHKTSPYITATDTAQSKDNIKVKYTDVIHFCSVEYCTAFTILFICFITSYYEQ